MKKNWGCIVCSLYILIQTSLCDVVYVSTLSKADPSSCGNVSFPCPSVQDAANIANSGDTLLLLNDGIYKEYNVTILQKSLTITGNDTSQLVLWQCEYGFLPATPGTLDSTAATTTATTTSGESANLRVLLGALIFNGGCATIAYIRFFRCVCEDWQISGNPRSTGGAITIMECNNGSLIENCEFSECGVINTETPTDLQGGAVYFQGKNISISNTTFADNYLIMSKIKPATTSSAVAEGGCIYVLASNLVISNNSIFKNCTITCSTGTSEVSSCSGAALYEAVEYYANITDTTFLRNIISPILHTINRMQAISAQGAAVAGGRSSKNTVSYLFLHKTMFHSNIARGNFGGICVGGALAITYQQIIITSTSFENNKCAGGSFGPEQVVAVGGQSMGGSIYAGSVNLLFLQDVEINSNEADGGDSTQIANVGVGGSAMGGGIYFVGKDFVAINISATHNMASGGSGDQQGGNSFGGFLYCSHAQRAVLYNSTAKLCTTIGGRGTLMGGDSFGTVYFDFVKESELRNCSIMDNTANAGDGKNGKGGVTKGGGIFYSSSVNITLDTLIVSENTLQAGVGNIPEPLGYSCYGAGIFINSSTTSNSKVMITKTYLANNLIDKGKTEKGLIQSGGGIYLQGCIANITELDIDNCSILNGYSIGGGLSCYHSIVYWNKGTVKNCLARSEGNSMQVGGGGIAVVNSRVTFSNITVLGNGVLHYDDFKQMDGGGLYIIDQSQVIVESCNFSSNSAGSGGAISSGQNCQLRVEDTSFINNEAKVSGGAIAIGYGSYSLDAGAPPLNSLNNCSIKYSVAINGAHLAITSNIRLICNNSFFQSGSALFGGAFWVEGYPTDVYIMNVTYSTITNNNALIGGGVIGTNSSANMVYLSPTCTIFNNTAAYGPALASLPSNVKLTCPTSLLLNNQTFGVSRVLEDDFGNEVKSTSNELDNYFFSGLAYIKLATNSSDDCIFVNSNPFNGTRGGVVLYNDLIISARNGTTCQIEVAIFNIVSNGTNILENQPVFGKCDIIVADCPKHYTVEGGAKVDYCFKQTPKCGFWCKIGSVFLILVASIGLTATLSVGGIFIYRRVKKWRKYRRVIPLVLRGRPFPTLRELIDDPAIPVLSRSELEIFEMLGKGAQGMVHKGKILKTDQLVAIKQIFLPTGDTPDFRLFLSEIKICSILNHKNVCPFMGILITGVNEVGMISAFMQNGSLGEFLKAHRGRIEMGLKLQILIGISRGIQYIHKMKLVHRDLKPENILLDSHYVPKLSDMGCATVSEQGKKMTLVGTPSYIAPELITAEGVHTEKVDIYSFGVIINEVISEIEPYSESQFENVSVMKMMNDIADGTMRPATYATEPALVSLVEECWNGTPEARPTAEEVKTRLKRIALSLRHPKVI